LNPCFARLAKLSMPVLACTVTSLWAGAFPSVAQEAPPAATQQKPSPAARRGMQLKITGLMLWRVTPDGSVTTVPNGVVLEQNTIQIPDLGSPRDVHVLGIMYDGFDNAPGHAGHMSSVWLGSRLHPDEDAQESIQSETAQVGSWPELLQRLDFSHNPKRIHRVDHEVDRGHSRGVLLWGLANFAGRKSVALTIDAFCLQGRTGEGLEWIQERYTVAASANGATAVAGSAVAKPTNPTLQLNVSSVEVWEARADGSVTRVPGAAQLAGNVITMNRAASAPEAKQLLRLEFQALNPSTVQARGSERLRIGVGTAGGSTRTPVWAGNDPMIGTMFGPTDRPALVQHLLRDAGTQKGLLYSQTVSPTESRIIGWWSVGALRSHGSTAFALSADWVDDSGSLTGLSRDYSIAVR
jgi:hypothetical protein